MKKLVSTVTLGAILALSVVSGAAARTSHQAAPPVQGEKLTVMMYVDTVQGTAGNPKPAVGCSITNLFRRGQQVVFWVWHESLVNCGHGQLRREPHRLRANLNCARESRVVHGGRQPRQLQGSVLELRFDAARSGNTVQPSSRAADPEHDREGPFGVLVEMPRQDGIRPVGARPGYRKGGREERRQMYRRHSAHRRHREPAGEHHETVANDSEGPALEHRPHVFEFMMSFMVLAPLFDGRFGRPRYSIRFMDVDGLGTPPRRMDA